MTTVSMAMNMAPYFVVSSMLVSISFSIRFNMGVSLLMFCVYECLDLAQDPANRVSFVVQYSD